MLCRIRSSLHNFVQVQFDLESRSRSEQISATATFLQKVALVPSSSCWYSARFRFTQVTNGFDRISFGWNSELHDFMHQKSF
jgi:hypothetical protein